MEIKAITEFLPISGKITEFVFFTARKKAAEKYPEIAQLILSIGSYKQYLTLCENQRKQ